MVSNNAWRILAALLLFLILLLPLRDGFTDDGFIHIQYAHNLITRGEYSFNPGEVSFGTTSPLWVFLQAAAGYPFGGGEALIRTSQVLSWLCGFLSVIFLFVLTRRLGGRPLTAGLAALVFAADAWFVRWTALGMETSAAVLAVIWVGIYSIDGFGDRRAARMFGFFMGMAALIRPEAYLLFPVYLAALLGRWEKVEKRLLLNTIALSAVMIVPWLLFAKFHIGSFMPNTAAAKSGGLGFSLEVIIRQLVTLAKIIGSTQALPVLAILASLIFLNRRSRIVSRSGRFMLLWIIALPTAYVIMDFQVLSRYMLLITPFIVVFGFIALQELAGLIRSNTRLAAVIPVAVAASGVVINVVFYFFVVVPPSQAFTRDLTHRLKSIAEYIRDNSDEDAVVAARDIGYVAFYSQRRVMDLGGLVDPVLNRLGEQYSYDEIVQGGYFLGIPEYPRVDYLIDMEKRPRRFEGRRHAGYRFESRRVVKIDNLGIRKPGPYYYTLYSLIPENDDQP